MLFRIEKILVLFSDKKIHENFQISQGNPQVREVILEEFENPGGFPRVFLDRNLKCKNGI